MLSPEFLEETNLKILVVDDNEDNRYLLQVLLKAHGHVVVFADNGLDALTKLRAEPYGLVVSDVLMPVMDGYRLCRECKQDKTLQHIPVILISAAYTEDKDESLAVGIGAECFVRRPIDPAELMRLIQGVIDARTKEPRAAVTDKEDNAYLVEYSERVFHQLEEKVKELEKEVAERKRAECALQGVIIELNQSIEDIVRVVARTVEVKDPYTAGHQHRVAALATAIGKEMNLDESFRQGLEMAATVHDLGKISIPTEVLSKPSLLNDLEFAIIKMHPEAGFAILQGVRFPWPIAEIVRQHHERLDGSGYPRGLKEGELLLESRIIAVADVMEAMSSHRPYRPGRGIDAALEEIARGRGKTFDAQVVDACVRLFREKHFAFPKDDWEKIIEPLVGY